MIRCCVLAVVSVIVGLLVAALQRRFSSETLINGWMEYEKGRAMAPTIFKAKAPDNDTRRE